MRCPESKVKSAVMVLRMVAPSMLGLCSGPAAQYLFFQISGAVPLGEMGCREFQKPALLILPSKFYRSGMWVRGALGVGRPVGGTLGAREGLQRNRCVGRGLEVGGRQAQVCALSPWFLMGSSRPPGSGQVQAQCPVLGMATAPCSFPQESASPAELASCRLAVQRQMPKDALC